MELSLDMLDVKDADAFIIWAKQKAKDYIIFIDGGKAGDGNKVVMHYDTYIRRHVEKLHSQPEIIIISTHPHKDHVGGIPYIIEYFKRRVARVYMNNPLEFMDKKNIDLLNRNFRKVKNADTALTRLHKSLWDAQELQKLITRYNIPIYHALSDSTIHSSDKLIFKFLGPSSDYYQELVNRFSSSEILESLTYQSLDVDTSFILEAAEVLKPCPIVDAKNDTSSENLASVITLFTTASGSRYLFTGDSGVESFERAKADGFSLKNMSYVQLPHHGSRRNISSSIICEMNPLVFFVSAVGNKKHPRRAVIECIKKNTRAEVFSTHKTGDLRTVSNASIFPIYTGYINVENNTL